MPSQLLSAERESESFPSQVGWYRDVFQDKSDCRGTGNFSYLGSLLRLTLGKDLVRVRSLLKVMSRTHGHEGVLDSG